MSFRMLQLLGLAVLACSPIAALAEGSFVTVVSEELKRYLVGKDLVVRGTLSRAERQAGAADGRWIIVLSSVQTLKGPRTETVTLFSLATPPPSATGSPILAYGSKTRSDGNRLWGSFFPIEVLENGTESVVVADQAVPTSVQSRTVDYRLLAESVRKAGRDPRTGESSVPYADIAALFTRQPLPTGASR